MRVYLPSINVLFKKSGIIFYICQILCKFGNVLNLLRGKKPKPERSELRPPRPTLTIGTSSDLSGGADPGIGFRKVPIYGVKEAAEEEEEAGLLRGLSRKGEVRFLVAEMSLSYGNNTQPAAISRLTSLQFNEGSVYCRGGKHRVMLNSTAEDVNCMRGIWCVCVCESSLIYGGFKQHVHAAI